MDRSAGTAMSADIAEQPEVLGRLFDVGAGAIDDVARTVRARRPRFVLLAARGTSDHAALYAKYLVEIRLGRPAGLVSPSTLTVYGARPDLTDVLLIAVSQSGRSPDLLGTVEAARACGALTVAVTNDPDSAVASAAELHVDLAAGVERAVAATKTYTAELLALYLLVAAIADGVAGEAASAAARVPELAGQVLARSAGPVEALAPRYRFAERMLTTGRGYAYPTAREAALKIMETSYLPAQAFSGADLLHGPLAVVDAEMPVIAVVPRGRAGAAMRPVLDRLVEGRADVVVVGDVAAAPTGSGFGAGIALPEIAEELSPILEILPLQLLARDLAVARGGDPDAPRGLSKVTETW
ncbi:MAG: glucosamine-6-phosphate deaminase [Pseudonocardiales bacterium]|nr:MAG: glucosamine-6-phosphate deaminase [Pseudonocardiales bacterium]